MGWLRTGLAAALVAASAACTTPGTPSESPLASVTVTSVPRPSAVPCPPEPKNGYSRCTSLRGDMDGDGAPDTLAISGDRAHLTRAAGPNAELELPAGTGRSIVGLYDVDGDGSLEAFVMVSLGANTGDVWILGYEGSRLRPLTERERTEPFDAALGAAAMHADGFTCSASSSGHYFTTMHTDKTEDGWSWLKTTYRWSDSALSRVATDSGVAAPLADGSPPKTLTPGAACGSLRAFRQ